MCLPDDPGRRRIFGVAGKAVNRGQPGFAVEQSETIE
jgi:hypothetical protein